MSSALSWWRRTIRALIPIPSRRRRRPAGRPLLALERFEERLTPSTFQWIGGPSGNWSNSANWTGGPGGTFPGAANDVAQFLDMPTPLPSAVSVTVDGVIGVGEIDFGTAASITLAGDGISGDGFSDGTGLILSQSGAGGATVGAPLLGSGALTITGTGAGGVTISGNNAGFTGAVKVNAGAVLNTASNNALGPSPNLIDNGTLNVVSGTGTAPGLAGTYYNFAGASVSPQQIIGNLASAYVPSVGSGSVASAVITNIVTSKPIVGPLTVMFGPPPAGGVQATGTLNGFYLGATITITNPGSGYTATPYVNITSQNGAVFNGFGAVTMTNSQINAVNVTNPGNGWFSSPPTVSFSGGGGSGATAHAVLNVSGSVASVVIDNGGSGYTSSPTVSFSLPPGLTTNPGFNGTSGYLSNYAATLGTPLASDSSAYENAANSGGIYFEYGSGIMPQPSQNPLNLPPENPNGGLANGFPAAVNSSANAMDCFMAIYQGVFSAPVAGAYTFGTGSEDSSHLWIDGQLVVDDNYNGRYFRASSTDPLDSGATTVPTLSAGPHSILVEFYKDGISPSPYVLQSGLYALDAFVTGPAGSTYPDGDPISGVLENGLLSHLGPVPTNLSIGSVDSSSTGTMNVSDNSATVLVGNPNGITVGMNNQGLTFASDGIIIAGGGTITAVGAGNVSFDAVEPFTGTLIADNSGVVQFGDTVNPGSENLTALVNNTGHNVIIDNSSTFALNANISGSSGLTLNGTGTYQLGGVSTFTGPVTVPSGATISVQGPDALGAGDVTDNGIISLDGGWTPGGLAGTYYYIGGGGPSAPASSGETPPTLSAFDSSSDLDAYLATLARPTDSFGNPVTGYSGSPAEPGSDATATVTISATGGTFTLSFEGQTTAPIPYNAPGYVVQNALDALSTVGGNNVSVAYNPGDTTYTVMFQNVLGNQEVDIAAYSVRTRNGLTVNGANLTGGAHSATVTDSGTGAAGLSGVNFVVGFPDPALGVDSLGDWQGLFYAPVTGWYGFNTVMTNIDYSRGGSNLYIDGNEIVIGETPDTLSPTFAGGVSLTAGLHHIEAVDYNQEVFGTGLSVDVVGPGSLAAIQNIPGSLLGLQVPGLSLGSLAGAGSILLNAGGSLTVGGDNSSTTFSGTITSTAAPPDGIPAFTKTGSGTLVMANPASIGYTGPTQIDTPGVLASIAVTNGGSGYTAAPQVFIQQGSYGENASAVATISGGKVMSVTITNSGFGFSVAPMVYFNGGAGSGAAATTTITNVGTLQLGDGSHSFSALKTSSIVDNGTLILNDPGGILTYDGTISGSGGVTMQDPFDLSLGGLNSYSGGTSISAGSTVTATSSAALGTGDVLLPATAVLEDNVPIGISPTGTGLAGTYYENAEDGPNTAGGVPPSPTPDVFFNSVRSASGNALASLGVVLPQQAITTDTTAMNNGVNGGTNVEYGGSTGRLTRDGTTGDGFPLALQQAGDSPQATNTLRQGIDFLAVWQGVFMAPVSGGYTFATGSTDSSSIWVDDHLVAEYTTYDSVTDTYTIRSSTDPAQPGATTTATLAAGMHTITIEYSEAGGSFGTFDYYGYNFDGFVQGPTDSGLESNPLIPNSNLGMISIAPLTLGSLSGAGTVNINSSALTVGTDNNSTTFSGTISGSSPASWPLATFTKAGTGILSATNASLSYSGSSTTGVTAVLDGGQLLLPAFPNGNILDNGNLTISLTGPTSYGGVISGSGGLTFTGTSTLTLSGASIFSGAMVLGGNSIKYGVSYALPPLTPIIFGSGSQIDLNGYNAAIGLPIPSGTGASNAILNSSNTPVTLTITISSGSDVLSVPISGPIAMTLAVTGGNVVLDNPAAFPGSPALVIDGTGVLDLNGGNLTARSLVIDGAGVLDLNGTSFTAASLSSGGNYGGTITNSSTIPATLTLSGKMGGPYAFAGQLTGNLSLVDLSGNSVMNSLTGAVGTFAGGLTVSSGTLAVSPLSTGTGPIALDAGSLDLNAFQGVTGFGGYGTGWTINREYNGPGAQFLAQDVVEITPALPLQDSQLWYDTPVQPWNGFECQFTYQDLSKSSAGGDGVVFVLQNSTAGTAAAGEQDGGLGYIGGNVSPSVALELNLYGGAIQGGAWDVNATNTGRVFTNPGAPWGTLWNGDPVNFTVTYDGNVTMWALAVDTVTGASATLTYTLPASLQSILGSASSCIMGMTGSTDGDSASQVLSNFSYQQVAPFVGNTDFLNNITARGNLLANITAVSPAYTIDGNVTVPSTATVNVAPDSASTPNQPYSLTLSGAVTLGGTLNLANNGSGTATLNLTGPVSGSSTNGGSMGIVKGNVAFTSSTSFNIVLGGGTARQYDQLTVNGSVNLNGARLTLTQANLFAPKVGQAFTIINTSGTSNTLSGQFVQGATIMSQGTSYSITYTITSVVLTTTGVPTATQLVLISPVIPPTGLTETAGTPFTFAVQAQDASGNPSGGYSGTLSVVDSAGGLSFSPSTLTITNGSVTVQATALKAGTNTLTITSTGAGGNPNLGAIIPSPVFTLNPGPLVSYSVTPVSGATVPAGSAFAVAVQAADPYGNPIFSNTGPAAVNASITPSTGVASSFPLSIAISPAGQGLALATINTEGSYTVAVADASTGTIKGTATSPVVIVPNVPTKLAFDAAGQPTNTPTGVKMPFVKVDVEDTYGNLVTSDNIDVVTIAVASGPPGGTFLTGSTLTATATAGVATFNNLTLVVPGTYTLGAVVPARYIGPNSTAFTIAPLQVKPGSFSSSPTGFSVQFNAPFLVNSTTPVLYGTGFGLASGQNGQPPTVFLTTDGTNLNDQLAYVPGTVVLNTIPQGPAQPGMTNSLQFIETDTTSAADYANPILPDGTYYAVIRGTSNISPNGIKYNGLQALNAGGGYLDGTNSGTSGHDYIVTFTVGATHAGDDVVWVPATADGPLQTLNAPGNSQQTLFQGGLPVYLDDFTGQVTRVTGTFTYNPTLLNVTGGSSNPSLSGSTFTLTVTTPGTATFTYSDSGANKLKVSGGIGSQNALIPFDDTSAPALGFITATVPNSSVTTPIYKAKDVLTLSNLQINSSAAIPVVGGSAVHLVAYAGDVDGNGSYSSTDAVLITRVLVSTDSGFAAYPLVDPTIVADTDGSGFVPGDAPLQANEAGVGFPTDNLSMPPVPAGANFTSIPNNVDPTLSVGRGAWSVGRDGQPVVTVPVNIDNAHPAGSTGLIRGLLVLTYDPSVFTVSAADIHPGSLLAGGSWSIVPTIDPTTGQILIALSSDSSLTSTQAGSLVTIDLHLRPGEPKASATGGVAAPVADSPGSLGTITLVAAGDPDGQGVGTELEDGQGTFTFAALRSPAWPWRKV